MTVDPAVVVLAVVLTVLALLGGAAGVVVALSNGRPRMPRGQGGEPGLVRVVAQVHTGWEQTLIGLHRELALPRRPQDLPYGALYLEPLHERRLLLRTRSEIGRGFLGVLDIAPGLGATAVTYRILRLPDDERIRDKVLDLELRLISAVRQIDRTVEVQLTGGPFRESQLAQPQPQPQPPSLEEDVR